MSRASLISSNLILTPSLYSSTITLYAPYGGSATITTASGSFIDGTTTKTTTGYITVRSNALNSNIWTIQDIFPYSNDFSDLDTVTIGTVGIRSTMYASYTMENSGYISTLGTISTTSFTQNGNPLTTLSNLTSTVNGLGNIYISGGSNYITSTIAGLGSYYISSKGIQSTVAGLGSTYVSTTSLVSTVIGYSNYIIGTNLISSVTGLSNLTYFMGTSLQSTVVGLSNIYINSNQGISTIVSLQSNETLSIISTVKTLSNYISSFSLQSTVDGLGYLYISSSKLNLLTSNFTLAIVGPVIESMVDNLAGTYKYISSYDLQSTVQGVTLNLSSNVNTLGYISSTQLQSTVAGLGLNYISSKSLQSTVAGIQTSGMTSTVAGLGLNYISSLSLQSTVTGLSNQYLLQLTTFYNGLGSNYISSPSLQSTVAGVGSLYISTGSLISSTLGYSNLEIGSLNTLVNTAGQSYVSTSGLVNATIVLSQFRNEFISTLSGLGSLYISSPQLVSTVQGLGSATYISIATRISTLTGYSNMEQTILQQIPDTAGSIYATKVNLRDAETSLISQFNYSLTSTLQGLTSVYITTSVLNNSIYTDALYYILPYQLESTMTGLYSNAGTSNLSQIEDNIGQTYISTSGLASKVDNLLSDKTADNFNLINIQFYRQYYATPLQIQSTVAGLGTIGYISIASFTSTTSGIYTLQYISTGTATTYESLNLLDTSVYTSTNAGMGTFGYISITSLTSSVSDYFIRPNYSTILGFSNVGFINSPRLNTNAYLLYNNSYLSTTSNFYEANNIVNCKLNISTIGTITATTIKTIGYGNNYLFGDGTYLTTSSDRELKGSIEPISSSDALAKVLSLRGVYYNKIGDTHKYIGCIAQEVEEVFPEVVVTHPSMNPVDLKSIKYDFLTAPLVESVKELISIHSTLKYFVQKKVREI